MDLYGKSVSSFFSDKTLINLEFITDKKIWSDERELLYIEWRVKMRSIKNLLWTQWTVNL